MKPRGRGVFGESGELIHFGKGRSVYLALPGKAVTVVQTVEKLADGGNPGADSDVCLEGGALFLIGGENSKMKLGRGQSRLREWLMNQPLRWGFWCSHSVLWEKQR